MLANEQVDQVDAATRSML